MALLQPMKRQALTFLFALCGLLAPALAHPIPEVPVRSYFDADGKAIIKVEVDPRVMDAEPEKAKYLFNEALVKMTEPEKATLISNATSYAKANVEFFFLPLGQVTPEFQWKITGEVDSELTKPDQPVMVTGTWQTTVPGGIGGYQVRATEKGKIAVYIHNFLRGQPLDRLCVLFPGEKSYVLDLAGLSAGAAVPVSGAITAKSTGGWLSTFLNLIPQGLFHVVPEGLDHILFVLGLFLLSRQLRPLLLQITTFTIAHTVTLGLATLGWVHLSPRIVEPIIAGSIAVVALENIYHAKYTPWRLLLVFGFGLVHGLGFAGALRDLDIPEASLIPALLGFNVGVEFGQLTVISVALALTFWIKDAAIYRKYIVIPGSLAIAAMGLYWMVERIIG